MLFLNAVSAQKDDSTLSKIAKSVAKVLIGIIAAAVLISCIILNLVVSLLPLLVFLAINRSIFPVVSNNQTSVNTESSSTQIINNKDYDKRIKEEIANLTTDQESSQEQYYSTQSNALVTNDQLYNQPDVKIISRNLKDEQALDQTIIVERINSADVQDGKIMVRTVLDENSVTVKGIFAGNIPDQQTGFASGFNMQCNLDQGGIGFKFGLNVRIGSNQKSALQKLLKNEEPRTMLSGNDGLLSIEQRSSGQRKSD